MKDIHGNNIVRFADLSAIQLADALLLKAKSVSADSHAAVARALKDVCLLNCDFESGGKFRKIEKEREPDQIEEHKTRRKIEAGLMHDNPDPFLANVNGVMTQIDFDRRTAADEKRGNPVIFKHTPTDDVLVEMADGILRKRKQITSDKQMAARFNRQIKAALNALLKTSKQPAQEKQNDTNTTNSKRKAK